MEKNMSKLSLNKKLYGLLGLLLMFMLLLSACSSNAASSGAPKPSNSGPAGAAVGLTGNATAGAEIFATNCVACHGDQGKGGVTNPGSKDGTVPALNPIEEEFKGSDVKTFITNMDLFIEHGSTPAGDSPALKMQAFGDQKTLTAQQIADVLAYLVSLNK
jgi:mono/diheme cytochrome c family protein